MTRLLRLIFPSILALALGLSGCAGDDTVTPPALSSDASIASLTVSAGTLSPGFSSTTLAYSLQLPHGASSFTVSPTLHDAKALSVAVGQDNGALFAIDSGSASPALSAPAVAATSTITVRGTAEDGSTANYLITVTQAPAVSTDATLSALTASAGTFTPSFSSATTAYALQVANGTASVTLTATVHEANAKITLKQDGGGFTSLASGTTSTALTVPAVSSSSIITVRVTAQDTTSTKDYVITLTQGSPVLSTDAALSGLGISAGALTPTFSTATFAYSDAVPNGTASVTVTPTAHAASATIQVKQDSGSFAAVASGSASASLAVPAVGGSSTLTVRVTAQDGVSTKDYVVTLTQAPVIANAFTLFLVGDSTMADYDPAVYPNQAGWGQLFRQFIVSGSGMTLVNAGHNGRSSKSFYNDGSWTAVKTALHTGDYVFVQFAHNDESAGGLESSDGISTDPFGAYQTYLGKYVDETRAAGATPIFVTPIVRRYFSGTTISAKGAHDLSGAGDHDASITQGTDLNYVEAMKQVATNKSVQVIDMTASTKQLVEQFGPTDAKSIIYIAADDTHIQPLGATLFAQLVVQELISKSLFVSNLNPAADLVVSPTSLDFGSIFIGATLTKPISVTGLSLSPASGNVTLTAPDGFLVSTSSTGTFGATAQLPYTNGRLAPTTVYVQFAPSAAQAYSAHVSVAPGSGNTELVAVSGTGMTAPTGGVESTAVYSMTTDATCAATGLGTCADETFPGVYVKSYQPPSATATTWIPSQPASSSTQRVSILNDTWPGQETTALPSRYAQFAVSPAAGKTWTIDSISFWAGGGGGSNMAFSFQYSKDADFGTSTTLIDSPTNATNTMTLNTFAPTITLNPGETLYIRAFPWLKGASASGKYLCLQTLTVHGTAQ
ncbi:MAG: cadherin-like beta sandwich domain-containing protein [Deltaproteobacteria bacterium]|nr:cadherin-like beta sandwich domain-containing protein [Deltaproteobacteria bacterium]